MIKLTTPEYDEYYEFENEIEAKNFLFGATDVLDNMGSRSHTTMTLTEVLKLQENYIVNND